MPKKTVYILGLIAVLLVAGILILLFTHQNKLALVPTTGQKQKSLSKRQTPIVWGAYVGDQPGDLANFEKQAGKPVNIQAIFVGWQYNSLFPTSSLVTNLKSTGKTLLIFWEPSDGNSTSTTQPAYNYDSINKGLWDNYISSFAADAKTYGGPVILVPFAEMNGNWDPWDGTVNNNTPAKFIAAWQRVRGIFKDAPNVKFGWDVNSVSEPDSPSNQIADYYPGDAYVDYVGVDGFNFGNPWQSFSEVFNPALGQLSVYKKPIYIFSFASASGPQKAAWITDALAVQISQNLQIAGWVWFNQNKEQNWLIGSDSASLSAFKAALP